MHIVATQINTPKGERTRKHLGTIFHLLHQGRPKLEYVAMQPLLHLLYVLELPTTHWSDCVGWALVECLFQ